MPLPHVEMQNAMMSGGMGPLMYMLGGGGVTVSTAVAAADTATATKAAVAGKVQAPVGFDISIRDDNLAANGYVKVEIEEDTGGGSAAVVWTNYYKWVIATDVVVTTVQEWFPWPLHGGLTAGLSMSCTVTTGVAADAVTVNLYTIPL